MDSMPESSMDTPRRVRAAEVPRGTTRCLGAPPRDRQGRATHPRSSKIFGRRSFVLGEK